MLIHKASDKVHSIAIGLEKSEALMWFLVRLAFLRRHHCSKLAKFTLGETTPPCRPGCEGQHPLALLRKVNRNLLLTSELEGWDFDGS